MRSNVAPGPDGLNAAFYKSSWNFVKNDVFSLVDKFYDTATLPNDTNKIFITLIPKKNQPLTPMDYRPIGLCNLIYKIVSKFVANRIKDHLTDFICYSQSAFVAGRHISSNIFVT
jgi:ribosomal protein S17E